MDTITNLAYRQRLAPLLLASPALAPASVQLGNGGFDASTNAPKPPRGYLYAPLSTIYPITPVLAGDNATLHVSVALTPGSEGLEFSEAVLLTADGTPIQHGTCLPQAVSSGVQAVLSFTLNGALVTDASNDASMVDLLSLYLGAAL